MSMYDREWYREKYNNAANQKSNKGNSNNSTSNRNYSDFSSYQRTSAAPPKVKTNTLRNRMIATICPLCGAYYYVQVKGGFGNTFRYKCPECGKKIWVRVEHITDKIVNFILGALGLGSAAYILLISYPALSDYLRMILQRYFS